MIIKKYRASRLDDVVTLVHEELGPEAIVLSRGGRDR